MARTDITGVSNTCPLIDSIITYAQDIAQQYAIPGKIISRHEAEEIERNVGAIEDMCEDIRDANSTLRDAAVNQHNEAQQNYQRAEDAEDKAHELQQALDNAEQERQQLEQELDHWQQYADSLEH